ncbi:unnamed protein product [Thlaspi arvense]|uniref:Uncharacterized protein n=1 Tax=Thlaspi arvense TaxID=13288 RepID=A0AAU9S1N3_THLAR|nr:unnamed protein product [Thlaspi arvense]
MWEDNIKFDLHIQTSLLVQTQIQHIPNRSLNCTNPQLPNKRKKLCRVVEDKVKPIIAPE